MPSPVYITGQAGTGKTTHLLEKTVSYAQELLTQAHQQLLAMAYMHGARRRLESSIEDHPACSRIPRTVSTLDSFALALLNRWRTALGISLPICAAPSRCTERLERHSRLHLPFEEITASAARLLMRSNVARMFRSTYPIVIIDEFQDCIGSKLDFVRALGDASQLILAGDAFQLLRADVVGCPAIDWVESLGQVGIREHLELNEPWRFSANPHILLAARALREQSQLAEQTIPVYYGPVRPSAWRIMERLLLGWYGPRWRGSTAIICPSGGGVVDDLLNSLADQTKKRGYHPIHWNRQAPSEEEIAILHTNLGVTNDHLDDAEWEPPSAITDLPATEVIERARRFAQLRGLPKIPKHLLSSLAEQMVHTSRAHGRSSSRFVVTTVHGAKNREFDNVCVLWSYQIPPDPELQRRLLYNAITRAKVNCVIFDTRRKDIVMNDPVVTLLGSPKPVFDSKPKARKGSHQSRTKTNAKRKK